MKRAADKSTIAVLLSICFFSACSHDATLVHSEDRREDMIQHLILTHGFNEPKVIEAFRVVPRENFVLPSMREHAYEDLEVPIGEGETIDRPYEDALILTALDISPGDRVLEVGTGSGYLASLMSRIAKEVYTIEINTVLAGVARANVSGLGYDNISVKTGDGFIGWKENAPFDKIIMTASPSYIPAPIMEQLAEGGLLLAPIGGTEKFQIMVLFKKENGKLVELRKLNPITFTPMKGKILEK